MPTYHQTPITNGMVLICKSSELESSMDHFNKDTHQSSMEEYVSDFYCPTSPVTTLDGRNSETQFLFDEMSLRGVDNCEQHIGHEKTELLNEGEDDHGMEELQLNMADYHLPASSKVSAPSTLQLSAPPETLVSTESPPPSSLPIQLSTTAPKHHKPSENFVENVNKLYAHKLFDVIPNSRVCSHDPYHHCFALILPPPRPPSQPPDISQRHGNQRTPSPHATPCSSSHSASQPPVNCSITDISLEGLIPFNSVDNVRVTYRTLVKAQVVLNETNHMLVKDVFFNEVLKLRSGTALVDMYSKFGNVEKALEVFCKSSEKDISTWNSMIAGLSTHGFGEHALIIFSQLLAKGYKPNEVTFIDVLSAWSRAGLLNEGRKMFDLMVRAHKIQPTIEHYGCMVDLLGRHGLLEEAEELARTMSLIEALVVWESLLSACKNHGNLELRKHVAGKFLELKPQDSAGYVQLSNTYASMGKWKDIKEVRKRMKAQSVTANTK